MRKINVTTDFLTNIQSNIKMLLYENGMKSKDLANALNIEPATVSRYLNGNRIPTLVFLVAVCDLFDVSLDFLVGLSDNKWD